MAQNEVPEIWIRWIETPNADHIANILPILLSCRSGSAPGGMQLQGDQMLNPRDPYWFIPDKFLPRFFVKVIPCRRIDKHQVNRRHTFTARIELCEGIRAME